MKHKANKIELLLNISCKKQGSTLIISHLYFNHFILLSGEKKRKDLHFVWCGNILLFPLQKARGNKQPHYQWLPIAISSILPYKWEDLKIESSRQTC